MTKMNVSKKLLAVSCAAIAVASSSVAQAAVLEEILVVANKVEESLQEVPLAVSAIGGNELAHSGVTETADLSARVPNLQVSSPYGNVQPNFSLRGISVGNEFNANQASPIGVYVDENYLSARFAHGMQLYDIAQLEVLRGPQGTLYGRNTTGGVVNVISQKPLMEDTQGYITAKLGNFNSHQISGAVDTQLVEDVLGLRIAGTWSEDDGQLDNVGTASKGDDFRETDSQAARASLLWYINEEMKLSIRAYYSDSAALGDAAVGQGVLPGGVDISGYSSQGLDFWESEAGNSGDYGATGNGVAATFTWGMTDNLTLTSITATDSGDFQVNQDADGGPNDIFNLSWTSDYDQFNQEFRLHYQGDSIKLTGGVYYGTDTVESRNEYNIFGFLAGLPFVFPPNPATGDVSTLLFDHRYDQQRDSFAVFGEAAWEIDDHLRLTVGLRYTEDDIELSNAQAILSDFTDTPQLNTVPFTVPADSGAFFPTLGESYSDVSGRVILDYTFNSGHMIYASYSKGYRAGAINGTAYTSASQLTFVEPENLDAYEVGMKTRLLEDRLQMNGAVFYYDYTDQQLQEVVGISPFLRNAGSAEVKGIELEVLFAATDALALGLNLGVLDSEYTDLQLSGIELSGNEFTNTPDMTVNLNADWDVIQLGSGFISVRADASYIGDQWFSPFNDQPSNAQDLIGNAALQQDGYWLLNGRLAWQAENVTVALWGRNLADKEYYSYGLDLRSFTGADYLVRGARRTYGVEVSYQF